MLDCFESVLNGYLRKENMDAFVTGSNEKILFSAPRPRNARINFRQFEQTHSMENVIYNELRMKGYRVNIGVVPSAEKNSGEK